MPSTLECCEIGAPSRANLATLSRRPLQLRGLSGSPGFLTTTLRMVLTRPGCLSRQHQPAAQTVSRRVSVAAKEVAVKKYVARLRAEGRERLDELTRAATKK